MKNFKKKELNNSNGITLIALVITIIVLLILAGISISMLSGENSILQKATTAKENTDSAQIKERIQLAYHSALANGQGSYTKDTLMDELKNEFETDYDVDASDDKNWKLKAHGQEVTIPSGKKILSEVEKAIVESKVLDSTNKTVLTDKEGNKVVVPAGFKLATDSGETVRKGIVIEDNDIQTYSDGSKSYTGNQYVWIPVTKLMDGNNTIPYSTTGKLVTGEEIKLSRYEFNSSGNEIDRGETAIISGSYKFTEDTSSGTNTHALNINQFKTSVETNGGYYIGRYEASYGKNSEGIPKAKSKISVGTPIEVGNVNTQGMLWNLIKQSDAINASRNLYTTVTSDLMNSYSWDTAIVYIQKCGQSNYTNYSRKMRTILNLSNTGNLKNSNGTSYIDNPCNINDMAENLFEWTTETFSNSRFPIVKRGSSYYSSNFTSDRTRYSDSEDVSIGFRVVLYL